MIVISSVRDNLNRFLENNKEDYSYVSIALHAGIEAFLENKKYKKVNINEGLGDIDLEKEYVDFIGRLNRDYNSLVWFATTVSYKGSRPLNLYTYLFNYYCLSSLIKRGDSNYILISDDLTLNNSIKIYCESNNIDCKFLDGGKRKSRLLHYKRSFLNAVYFLCKGWSWKMLASIYLSRDIKKSLNENASSYYIVRSWINSRAFIGDGGYRDLYFGSLIEYLKKKKMKFIILAGIIKDYKELICKIKKIKQLLIIPQEYFVGYSDYIKVFIMTFIRRPKIIRPVIFCGLDVTDFLKESLEKDYESNEINKNLLYTYYAKRLLKNIKVNTFLFSLENQSWERMSIFAFRKDSPSTRIIGYAHSSFSPFLISYIYSGLEKDIIPVPDKIVTEGKKFKEFLQEYGNYESGIELSEGCALRYEHIFKKKKIEWNQGGRILVTLSMDFNLTLRMLRFLCNALGQKDGYHVLLRPHPFTPIGTMFRDYDLRLCNNFQVSKNLRFEHDLTNSGLIIYTDTTCSVEALMCGIPAVHLDLKESLTLDPLFKLGSLKWTVSTKDEIYKVLEHIYKMTKKEYLEGYAKALLYLKDYFYPVEERYLKEFTI